MLRCADIRQMPFSQGSSCGGQHDSTLPRRWACYSLYTTEAHRLNDYVRDKPAINAGLQSCRQQLCLRSPWRRSQSCMLGQSQAACITRKQEVAQS